MRIVNYSDFGDETSQGPYENLFTSKTTNVPFGKSITNGCVMTCKNDCEIERNNETSPENDGKNINEIVCKGPTVSITKSVPKKPNVIHDISVHSQQQSEQDTNSISMLQLVKVNIDKLINDQIKLFTPKHEYVQNLKMSQAHKTAQQRDCIRRIREELTIKMDHLNGLMNELEEIL